MTRPVYILGTNLSHDGSTCLLKDGEVIVGIEKERITRRKHDGFNDNQTIEYCLRAADITFKDVSFIVEKLTVNKQCKPDDIVQRAGRAIPSSMPIIKVPHHKAHAYSALAWSKFRKATIAVFDGMGGSIDSFEPTSPDILPRRYRDLPELEKNLYFEKESCYQYADGKMETVWKDVSAFKKGGRQAHPLAPTDIEHSIAGLYGSTAELVFGRPFNEGKLMGLAPYGRPGRFEVPLFVFTDEQVLINYESASDVDLHQVDLKLNFQYCADLAAWVQSQTEAAAFHLLNRFQERTGDADLCLAGGFGLNAVFNSKIVLNTAFSDVFVQPAAADNGLALGACYFGWNAVLGRDIPTRERTLYMGASYNWDPVSSPHDALGHDSGFQIHEPTEGTAALVAQLLADGKVVGFFQAGAEFGPRALGHRSIIADPRRVEMRDYVNREIKQREDFRPFAPIVKHDRFNDFFLGDPDKAEYMIFVFETRVHVRSLLGATTHVDGSARVQALRRPTNPLLYSVLDEFDQLTGLPVLLNTSFNGREEPIVETPDQALRFFVESKLDAVVIDGWLMVKAAVLDNSIE
jgi:carbamoyltransferase